MKKIFYKKVIIFDLDGVLVDSKTNMKISWSAVQKKFNLQNIKFYDYFSKIGQPFFEILKQLNIKNNYVKIKSCYDETSIQNLKTIKYFPRAIETLRKLKLKGHFICIATSKDNIRAKLILSDILNLFVVIQCPVKNLKGKPHPDQINNIIKKLKVSPNDCIYIGDTKIDYLTSKNSNIDFLFAEWGYSKLENIYTDSIKKIEDILDIILI